MEHCIIGPIHKPYNLFPPNLYQMIEARLEENFYFVIVGMNPPLYFAHPKIIFTGAVDDLAAYIQMADVCVCPLFSGGGTRLKLLEYMAAGKAIVSTKGAEGIHTKV